MSDKIDWLKEPEDHNYPASESYLTLVFDSHTAKSHTKKLRGAKVVEFKAKDIFRASRLSLLGISNSHVEKNLKKIHDDVKLSPILLVRDIEFRQVIIADGYHRLCAVYHYDEDALIPCKIV
jgi:disulfide oxidoreductase YuzD